MQGLPLTEKVINGFYFEIGEIDEGVVRIAAFVTPEKPNITSNPVANEAVRIQAMQQMFGRLRDLKGYNITIESPDLLKANGVNFLVTGIRANISRKDKSIITAEDVTKLIEKNLTAPPF